MTQLLESFKNYLLSQKKLPSNTTVINYLADVKKFIYWFEGKYKKPFLAQEINVNLILEYKKFLLETFSAVTVERQFSALRKFFQYLQANSEMQINPFEELSISQQQNEDPWHLRNFKNSLYINN